MFRSLMTRVVAVALGLAIVGGSASAAYQVRITMPDGFSTIINDGGSAVYKDSDVATVDRINVTDLGVSNPAIVYNFGGKTLTFTTLNTNSLAPAGNSLTWQYEIQYSGAGASGPLKLEFSRNGFMAPSPGPNVLTSSASGTFAAGSLGTVAISQGYGAANTLFTTSHNIVHPIYNSPTSFGQDLPLGLVTTTPYSFTSVATLNFAGNGIFLGNGTISLGNPVPVPAGLVLALTGLPALGFVSRLRRRNAVQA